MAVQTARAFFYFKLTYMEKLNEQSVEVGQWLGFFDEVNLNRYLEQCSKTMKLLKRTYDTKGLSTNTHIELVQAATEQYKWTYRQSLFFCSKSALQFFDFTSFAGKVKQNGN